MTQTFRLLIAAGLTLGNLSAQVDVTIDWPSKTLQNFPTRLEPPAKLKVTVKDVNDYLYSYKGSINVDPTPVTSISAAKFGSLSDDRCKSIDDVLARIDQAMRANFVVAKTANGKYPSIPMETSRAAWKANLQTEYTLMEAADATAKGCQGWNTYEKEWRPAMQRLSKADSGKHEYPFEATISENGKVTVTIIESYKDEVTDEGERNFVFQAQSGRFFLSVGFLATQVQARSYDVVDVGVIKGTAAVAAVGNTPAVAAVPDQTKKELRIQGTGSYRPTAAVLLNYKIPLPKFMGPKYGFALSAGPVYRISQNAGASTASNWGLFAGASLHLWERLWITPGFHIGEFSDLPRGFTAADGLRIPDGFPSTFSGVNRFTTRFGIGITFRAADFKAASSLLVSQAPAGSGAATSTGQGLAGATATTGATGATAVASAAGPSAVGAAVSGSSEGSLTKDIVKLRDLIAAAQKKVKDAEAGVKEKDATRQGALYLKAAADAAVSQAWIVLDDKTTDRNKAREFVNSASAKLLAANQADRPAAQAALDDAQNKLQGASEALGTAMAKLEAAKSTVSAAQDTVVFATAQSTAAIDALAKARKTLAALEEERKAICNALGGCLP